jgi:hypothetical protein
LDEEAELGEEVSILPGSKRVGDYAFGQSCRQLNKLIS